MGSEVVGSMALIGPAEVLSLGYLWLLIDRLRAAWVAAVAVFQVTAH